MTIRACLAAGAGLLLLSCGGGGGGGGGGGAPGTSTYAVVAETAAAGKVAGAVLASTGTPPRSPLWTQTGGPTVALLSARTQAISFQPPQPGAYQFQVSFVDGAGVAQTRNTTVNVAAAPAGSTVVARVDHAVRPGGNVSLRAWESLAAGDSAPTFTWTQLEGPTVTLDTSDPRRVLFVAPGVSQDTVLRFRVTMQTALGTDSDTVLVLVENHAQAPDSSAVHVFAGLHVSRVYAYRSSAQGNPYASLLAGCVYDSDLQWTSGGKNLCPLSSLPFLHQDTGGNLPTVAQVMNRVLVSHDWMGEAFEQFLQVNDASGDIRRLLNGVTAVVIGAQVRPSFYYALTGAIYLDADNFWLTPEQRDVINEAPDFRSDFDRDLNYSGVWRYTLNNASIFLPFPATSRISRSVDYLLYEAGWLMYHELGHANDFMPVAARATLDTSVSAWDNIAPRFNARQLVSDQITFSSPLQSAEMRGLAQVKFQGAQANATQIAWSPQTVAGFFAADRASDEYNYSTSREDTAMLFEEFMMFRNLGARRDVAITDKITPTTTGGTLIVRWGQRGRAGETQVKPRVNFVTQQLAPWVTAADPNAVTNLPAPIAMRPGESWTANLSLPAPPPGLPATAARARPQSLEEDAYLLRRAVRRRGHDIPALPGDRGR